jgi:hypothetical protein
VLVLVILFQKRIPVSRTGGGGGVIALDNSNVKSHSFATRYANGKAIANAVLRSLEKGVDRKGIDLAFENALENGTKDTIIVNAITNATKSGESTPQAPGTT